MIRVRHIAMTLILLLTAACGEQPSATRYTEEQRQAADSIVATATSIALAQAMTQQMHNSGNRLGEVVALRQLGKLYREETRFVEAIDCHQRGLALATEIADTLEIIQALNNIGTNYRRMGSLEEAAHHHNQAVVLSSRYGPASTSREKKSRVVSLNGMGNVLLSLGDLNMADSIFRQALHGEQELGSHLGQAINLANIGAIKEQTGQTDSARYYYQLSLQMNEEAHSDLGIGLCHLHFGELAEHDSLYDKALEEYRTAYDVLKPTGDDWHWLESVLDLARVYIKIGKTTEAREHLDTAGATIDRIGSQEHKVELYELYYKLYERTGDLRKALDNYISSTELDDSLMNTKKLSNIQNQRIATERIQREHELELAREQVALERQQKTTILVASIALLLLTLALIGLMWYHMHNRAVKQRMMQQVQQTRENFFTNITHEFRTPLTVVLGMAHQLEDYEHEDMAQVRSAAKMIVRQGNSLLGLINQLLDVSKVRSAVGEAKWSHSDIVAFIAMSIETFRPYAESKRQELTFTHSQTTLEMDFVPDYVEKILSNLLTNAIKYTPSYGKVNVTVEQCGNGRMKIQVFDTGRGIKSETLPHIFEMFTQGDTHQGDVGTGVGLSLVRLMVEGMDGTVDAESIEGQGSTFTVVLPMRNRHITPAATPSPNSDGSVIPATSIPGYNAPATPHATKSGSNETSILIVEDNQDIAFYIGMHLKGSRLLYARSGDEGLQKAQETIPDLIITDIMMPGDVDGVELCRRIRQNELLCHIPIVIITAKTTESDRIKGLEAGADAYLVKPFNSEELLVRVNKLLERQQTLRNKYAQESLTGNAAATAELKPNDRAFMNRLVDVVYKLMPTGNIDMDSVASEMAVSRTQLNRKVLAITGQNASSYVMTLRLARARRLLKADITTPVGDVALKCGFDDVAYFSRIFKQTYNMTPTQYRRQET